ncbi:diacylglycerol kinase family protein [Demequina sp. SYSU T00039]|uniref:Diacylglycerol kinase family protein n=1 Tax=Demequina lignilytica TaxID=3051663 RepID=A0AAW7M7H8_9MICO|nr:MULTISPECIES: diacylglycerol kinase family protein [unclassified Demequina]MDN4477699.1 diacylglycerol kinase family protein [Demequina sp. SYSU T00039-1]MDN4487608.1 diacylglycerol kinase family protein [Demequina sp. SYSU T00039]MDN4491319.1 diacylglycerol kinase family protein [Demequina sp. SYSU T00068]
MPALVIALVALALAIAALSLAIAMTRRIGLRDPVAVPPLWRRVLRIRPLPAMDLGAATERSDRQERVAFIANPTKANVAELREQALRACAIRYLPQPMWLYTTPDDPGVGQAREALAAGADLVVAVGGDGTVRAVAEALAGTGVPMGILPLGTGNLFARNLDLPLDDPAALLRTVLEGGERLSDVGWLELVRSPDGEGEGDRHIFLVIAGAGLDAEMVAGATDQLKRRLGWLAYFFAAARHLGKRMDATIAVDAEPPAESTMRTVLLANVGRLPAGLRLIPDASFDDGRIDVAAIDARGGLVGWTELFGVVVAKSSGIREPWLLSVLQTSRIDYATGERIDIRIREPQNVQVDGESMGRATRLRASVQAGALTLRVPRSSLPDPSPTAGDPPD